ncbi:MAG: DUF454 family protein, partial [Acidobacteria bacterium]|nr:DUF454 family protein [Acidobacteriota bacterium]
KTRTGREPASYAEQQDAQVLWGWCYEEEGAPSYWPWVQPIRSYVRQTNPEQLRSQMGAGASDIAEIVGIVLPLIPTTGPLILAAFAFSPSSDRMRDRLMNHTLSVASAPISRPAAGSPQVEDRRGRRHDRGLHLLHRVGHRTDGSPGAHGGDRSQGDLVRPPPADGSGGLEVCRPMAPTYLVTIGHLAQPDEGAVESASRRRQRRGGRGPERCGDDWYHRPLGTL